jgi:hypothetical protein
MADWKKAWRVVQLRRNIVEGDSTYMGWHSQYNNKIIYKMLQVMKSLLGRLLFAQIQMPVFSSPMPALSGPMWLAPLPNHQVCIHPLAVHPYTCPFTPHVYIISSTRQQSSEHIMVSGMLQKLCEQFKKLVHPTAET